MIEHIARHRDTSHTNWIPIVVTSGTTTTTSPWDRATCCDVQVVPPSRDIPTIGMSGKLRPPLKLWTSA
jgi:hypothetical protein